MNLTNIFGHDVYTSHCANTDFYQNKKLLASIELLLDNPLVTARVHGGVYDSVFGNILTSVGNDYSDLTVLPGSTDLIDWITAEILSIRPGAGSLQYLRSWSNKMFKDSEGLVHAHSHTDFINTTTEFVAIFYIQATPDSANLIFIKDGVFNTRYRDYTEDQRYPIPCQSGDLVVHDIEICHSVGQHIHDEPRICFVLEGRFDG
jgi:hypothetical protein